MSLAGSADIRPTLLVCGFDHFPGMPENPAALAVERLRARAWSPPDGEAAYAVIPTTWSGAVEACCEAARRTNAQGVLLVGVAAAAESFRVEMRAENRCALDKPDALGAVPTDARIAPLGPAAVRTGAPVEPMVAALEHLGMPAHASSDAGDYLCNYTYYRLLADGTFDRAAFLHVPPTGLDEIERAVEAVAVVLARALALARRTAAL